MRLTYYSMRGSENDGWYLKPGVTKEEANTKLAEYETAEEQGLLLRLPCKVGTYVYIVNYLWIDEGNICGLAECDDTDCACYKVYVDSGDCQIISFSEFGKTWFLTREEAEYALAEKGGAE